MQGDFSRWTYDAAKRYRRVMQQQGRVLTDADWNELNALLAEETRLLAADLIGPYGGPKNNFGFTLTTTKTDTESDLSIGTGHYWVDGLLCVVDEPTSYRHQPHLPFVSSGDGEFLDGTGRGVYLAYLEVWERHLTENDDPLLRDPALTETCSRSQLIWQVQVVKLPVETLAATAQQAYDQAEAFLKDWGDTTKLARLKAQVGAGKPGTDPCILPADARYRGRENQLYRVEIHQGGENPNTVSWKWSRDNGSVTFPIVRLEGTSATVGHLGRDNFSTLHAGDWVEILDDALILHNKPGPLAQITSVERDEFLVTMEFSDTNIPDYAEGANTHPFLRRWDYKGNKSVLGGALSVASAVGENKTGSKLEYGIEIQFAALPPEAVYRTGDYWLIPARTETGGIEWPENTFLAPQGVARHYAPLALLQNDTVLDIRFQFAPLAALVS